MNIWTLKKYRQSTRRGSRAEESSHFGSFIFFEQHLYHHEFFFLTFEKCRQSTSRWLRARKCTNIRFLQTLLSIRNGSPSTWPPAPATRWLPCCSKLNVCNRLNLYDLCSKIVFVPIRKGRPRIRPPALAMRLLVLRTELNGCSKLNLYERRCESPF